jgi:hypothetical protein
MLQSLYPAFGRYSNLALSSTSQKHYFSGRLKRATYKSAAGWAAPPECSHLPPLTVFVHATSNTQCTVLPLHSHTGFCKSVEAVHHTVPSDQQLFWCKSSHRPLQQYARRLGKQSWVQNCTCSKDVYSNEDNNGQLTRMARHCRVLSFIWPAWATSEIILRGVVKHGQVAGFCECGNEPSGSIKCGECLD